jgi:hypothetical protein
VTHQDNPYLVTRASVDDALRERWEKHLLHAQEMFVRYDIPVDARGVRKECARERSRREGL